MGRDVFVATLYEMCAPTPSPCFTGSVTVMWYLDPAGMPYKPEPSGEGGELWLAADDGSGGCIARGGVEAWEEGRIGG